MRSLFFALILLSSLCSRADVFEYYTPSYKKDVQAKGVFHMKTADKLNCTGFFVGPNGEALTALHCVEPCLKAAGVVTQEPYGAMVKNKVQPWNADTKVVCNTEYSQNGAKPNMTTLEVLHVFGPGFLGPRENLLDFRDQSPELFAQALTDGFEGWGDLALIRMSMTSGGCVRVQGADFSQKNTRPVFGLGYPIAYRATQVGPFAPDVIMTTGLTLLYSRGVASRDVEIFGAKLQPVQVDFIKSFLVPGTFLSTLDVEGGSSGSPVFANDGTVVGAIRSTFNPSMTEFAPWMAEAVDFSIHQDEIRRLVPENANCGR